jgi:hypothetical protein
LFSGTANEPVEGLKPYRVYRMEGRDVYIANVSAAHQMIRPFRAETEALWLLLGRRSVWTILSCGVPTRVEPWPAFGATQMNGSVRTWQPAQLGAA